MHLCWWIQTKVWSTWIELADFCLRYPMAETKSFARLDSERSASLSKALTETIVVNACLLLLTACLFGLIRYQGQVLEQEAAESRQELAMRDLQLEKLTSALSNQARSKTSAIEVNARLCSRTTGDFYHDKATNMLSR